MSLDVSPALLEQAERGEVDEAAFVDCVRTSLPYAWGMISSLVAQLKVDGGEFADNQTPPPDEQARGQLLRALASDAIRVRWSGTSVCGSPFRTATGSRSSRSTGGGRPPGPIHLHTGPAVESVAATPRLLNAVAAAAHRIVRRTVPVRQRQHSPRTGTPPGTVRGSTARGLRRPRTAAPHRAGHPSCGSTSAPSRRTFSSVAARSPDPSTSRAKRLMPVRSEVAASRSAHSWGVPTGCSPHSSSV